jgi:hypothetical protein
MTQGPLFLSYSLDDYPEFYKSLIEKIKKSDILINEPFQIASNLYESPEFNLSVIFKLKKAT